MAGGSSTSPWTNRGACSPSNSRTAAWLTPRRDAVVTGEPVFEQRDTHVENIAEIGRRRWRVEAGQHAQARAENTFSRYKRLFGGWLRARGEMAQRNEALTACNILNRMSELGIPRSERLATA